MFDEWAIALPTDVSIHDGATSCQNFKENKEMCKQNIKHVIMWKQRGIGQYFEISFLAEFDLLCKLQLQNYKYKKKKNPKFLLKMKK